MKEIIMLCAVYKSLKKEDTFLYIEKRDDFSRVPESLLETFGKPHFVLIFNMAQRDKLAIADVEKVKASLTEQGFYLQIPPPKENLLKTHKLNQSS